MPVVRFLAPVLLLAISLACGSEPAAPPPDPHPGGVDPATAATLITEVTFDGQVPKPDMITITGDPKCVAENGGEPQRPDYKILASAAGKDLQNVFVYIKEGLEKYSFPVPTDHVVIDQDKCQYTPRVVGVRVGQVLRFVNNDPLLHNVRGNAVINQTFNKSTPVEGMMFDHVFATREVMVPIKCDVHGWMTAYVGVLDHSYYGTTGSDGKVTLSLVPPGTYTIETWHEALGTKSLQVTLGPKEVKNVSITYTR